LINLFFLCKSLDHCAILLRLSIRRLWHTVLIGTDKLLFIVCNNMTMAKKSSFVLFFLFVAFLELIEAPDFKSLIKDSHLRITPYHVIAFILSTNSNVLKLYIFIYNVNVMMMIWLTACTEYRSMA